MAFASLLIYEGLFDEGLMVVRNVDDRYRRWGMYWDHQEFGGHYFRQLRVTGHAVDLERKERFLVADFPMEQTVLAGSRIELECL